MVDKNRLSLLVVMLLSIVGISNAATMLGLYEYVPEGDPLTSLVPYTDTNINVGESLLLVVSADLAPSDPWYFCTVYYENCNMDYLTITQRSDRIMPSADTTPGDLSSASVNGSVDSKYHRYQCSVDRDSAIAGNWFVFDINAIAISDEAFEINLYDTSIIETSDPFNPVINEILNLDARQTINVVNIVPEPASLGLLFIGSILISGRKRKSLI